MAGRARVGIIGCGNISGNCLHWARQLGVFEVAALAVPALRFDA